MKITNKHGLPEAIVKAVENDSYKRGMSDITVTELIGPPLQRILRREHSEELEEDASDRVWALLGQAAHTILERASDEGAVAERRLYKDIEGWTLGGQFDTIDLANGVLADYKVTSVYSLLYGEKPEWTAQLNVLAQLAIEHGFKVDKLQIVVIARDWSHGKSKAPDYPSCPIQVVDIPLWMESERLLYIKARIDVHKAAEVAHADGGHALECTVQERWEKPARWAVMKEGRKTAIKVHESSSAAQVHLAELGNKHYIEQRPGARTRCQDYCVLSKCGVCPYYNRGLANEEA